MPDLHDRLTAAVHARLELARAAAGPVVPGNWEQPDPVREPGLIVGDVGERVTYGESHPDERQAAHIVANDPATVIRHCARDLAVLERHAPSLSGDECNACRPDACDGGWVAWPCSEISLLATAYGIEVPDAG